MFAGCFKTHSLKFTKLTKHAKQAPARNVVSYEKNKVSKKSRVCLSSLLKHYLSNQELFVLAAILIHIIVIMIRTP